MTFSTQSVVDAVNQSFIPVWESVSPVRVASFKLDDERTVEGTIGGEIMLYFCRPDGKVFDALPGLQSPAIVQAAIKRAAKFYDESGGAPDEAIMRYNRERQDLISKEQGLTPEDAKNQIELAHAKLKERLAMGDPATSALTTSYASKVIMTTPAETITVVEPGGLWYYSLQAHDYLRTHTPRTPMEWKNIMFQSILDMPLGGGYETYDPNDVVPLSIPPGAGAGFFFDDGNPDFPPNLQPVPDGLNTSPDHQKQR